MSVIRSCTVDAAVGRHVRARAVRAVCTSTSLACALVHHQSTTPRSIHGGGAGDLPVCQYVFTHHPSVHRKKKGGDRTLKDYYPKSRVSKADTEGDHHSLDRTLDGRLFLVLKKPRAEHKWQFPQAPRQKGETMREVRVLTHVLVLRESAPLP